MARFPIYTAEDIKIPGSHAVGKRLMKGELFAEAAGTGEAPGIELGWAGPAPNFRSTLFQARPLLGCSARAGHQLLEDA